MDFISDLDVSVVIVAAVDDVEQMIAISETLRAKLKGVILDSIFRYLVTYVTDVVASSYKETCITN